MKMAMGQLGPRARQGVRLVGIGAAARALSNAQPGRTGVTPVHLRAVVLGERRSDRLLAEVRERFPGLLAPGGLTWREWEDGQTGSRFARPSGGPAS